MPYIKPEDRKQLVYRSPESAGELNYAITMLCKEYLAGSVSYMRINDVLGALEGAKLEFYRRIAAPYEDTKIQENGDVY
jgi:hypothetical protein